MHIKGCSFHVGSGGVEAAHYEKPLRDVKNIFEKAKEMELPEMDLVDIGGGFTYISEPGIGRNFNEAAP